MIVTDEGSGPCVLLADRVGAPIGDESLSVEFTDEEGEPAPKIRCRAAWYCASRSAYDFCCESGGTVDVAETE